MYEKEEMMTSGSGNFKEVYCKDCKYSSWNNIASEYFCNKIIKNEINPYTGKIRFNRIISSQENKNGDCKYFEKSLSTKMKEGISKIGKFFRKE